MLCYFLEELVPELVEVEDDGYVLVLVVLVVVEGFEDSDSSGISTDSFELEYVDVGWELVLVDVLVEEGVNDWYDDEGCIVEDDDWYVDEG